MKKIVLSLFAFVVASSLMAQNNNFGEGDKVLNLGIGLGTTLYSGLGNSLKVPPISASLEFGFKDDFLDVQDLSFGLGGYIGYASYKYEAPAGFGTTYSNFILGPRASLHYPLVDKLDTYSGLMIGYRVVSSSRYGNWPSVWGDYSFSTSSIWWMYYIGGRYYFTDNVAAMLELGYGIAYINLGVALKF